MIVKLKNLGTLKVPNRIKYSEGSKYNVADVTAIDINNLFLKDYKKTDDKTNLLKKDDLVIVSFDYSGNALGYTFHIDKNYKYVAGIDTIIFTESKVNSKALKYYFSGMNVKKQINKFSNSALMTISKRISINDLKEIEIDLDKLKEIEKNISVYENLSLYIEECWKSLKTAKTFYKEVKKDIFSKAENWDSLTLFDCCNVKAGTEAKPSKFSKEKSKSLKFPVFSGTSEVVGYTDKANSFDKYILYVSRGAKCGNSLYIKDKSFVINKMIMIETKDINPKFLSYQLEFFKPGIEGGGLTKFVSLDTLKKSKIYIPSKKEQNEIAKTLDNFEKLIEDKNSYFKNLLDLRKELLREI